MATKDFDPALEIFGDLLPKIGREVLEMRRKGQLDPINKKAQIKDLRTAADIFAQGRIRLCVHEYWPEHGIRGEEDLEERSDSGYDWLIDPIDATNRFTLGFDLFAISTGPILNGVPIFGVFYFPVEDIFVNAAKDKGTFINRERVVVSEGGGLKDEVFVGFALRTPEEGQKVRSFGCHIMEIHSFTGTTLLILQGKVGAYVHGGATPFDVGATALAAMEAGCVVSQLDGKPIDFSQKNIPVVIARNRKIWEGLLEICGS